MPFWDKKGDKGDKKRRSPVDVLAGPDADGLDSPLKGKSIPRIIVIVGVAIAIPGGVYVLAALVVLPLMLRRACCCR